MEDEEIFGILQNLTEFASVENLTVLKDLFQNKLSEVPLLHKTVAASLSRDDKHRIVRSLIEAGANCDQRDEKSRLTPCEFALLRLGDRELALEMIRAEVKNLPEERAFYLLIRRGSLEVFKLFLEAKQFSEEEIFHNVANAMVELNVKRVEIDEKLEVFLQFLLAKYAHQNLCGDVKINKNVNEWRLHFQLIEDNWKALKQEYSDSNFVNVDNMFLYRIQTIHNHLYFIKDKRFLRHLPMMEITFCLAIFVSIFKWSSEYEIFRLLINKINVMQFLDVVCRQLARIRIEIDRIAQQIIKMLDGVSSEGIPSKEQMLINWTKFRPNEKLGENIVNKIISGLKRKHDSQAIADEITSNESLELSTKISSRDRSTLRKLKRCYFQTRHLYSVQKCIYHILAISSYASGRKSDLITVPAVKRLIQVIGEAIKTTKNSPNMPKKVESVLEQMLTPFFPEFNKHFREFFSHKYSLAKRLLSGTDEATFIAIADQIGYVEMVFSFALIQSLAEGSRTLLGVMRRCRGVDQLATLFQYVPQLRIIEAMQLERFEKIEEMFRKVNEGFSKALVRTEIEQRNLNYLKKVSPNHNFVIEKIRLCLISKWEISFETIKTACHGNAPLQTIYRMIEYNLSTICHRDIYDDVKNHWLQGQVHMSSLSVSNKDLLNFNPSVISGVLKNLDCKLTVIEDEEYLENTNKILEELGFSNPSEEVIHLLHKQLLKYYEDIFFLDNKYKTIKQFFKTQKIQLDEQRFKEMRKTDEEELQNIFNRQTKDMQIIMQSHRIASVDDSADNIKWVPGAVMMALEHYQLELCETLITVGHYGDNFHLLKHRIPLINGRNYRNYLAHDQLSYNVLTDSSRIKIAINAIVMVNSSVDLYGKKCVDSVVNVNFPSLKDTLGWMTRQKSLMKNVQELNHDNIQSNVDKGADLHGRFIQTNSTLKPMNTSSSSLNFVDPNSSEDGLRRVLKFFEAEFPQECKKILSPSHRSWYAAQQENFEDAFKIFAVNQPVRNSALPQNFFYWKHLISHLQDHSVDWNEKDSLGRTILHKLVQAGNYFGVVELLTSNPDTDPNVVDKAGRTPLEYAIKYGHLNLAELFLLNAPSLSVDNQQYAVMNHLNELFPHLFAVVEESVLVNEVYILTAVKANNLIALEFIFKHLYTGVYSQLRRKHLSSSISLAAYLNHSQVVEYLLSLPNVDYFSDEHLPNGNVALQHSIRRRNWSTVKALLRCGASPHWVHPDDWIPLRTAFQLAVEVNSCQVVGLMGNVGWKMYRELRHPLAIAIENDSLKMVEFLEKVRLSLLDSNKVLHSAIKHNRVAFIEQIFRVLDELVEEWKTEDESFVGMVGNLLSRWKAITYLEEMEENSETVLMGAINAQNWNLLKALIEKCKNLRKVKELYLEGIQVYCNQKLIYSNDQKVNPEYTELCEDLLNRLKLEAKSDSNQLKLQSTVIFGAKERSIDAILFNVNPSNKDAIKNTESTANLQHYFTILQVFLHGTNGLICGMIDGSSSTPSYFVVSSIAACLLSLNRTEQKYQLEKFVNRGLNSGESPLHLLATNKDLLAPLELLLSNGANPLAKNTVGLTPLHLALIGTDSSKAMLLLETLNNGSALQLPTGDGFQPIHLASMSGKLQAVQYLIDQGVDLRARDNMGCNATVYAGFMSYRSILKILLDRDPQLLNLQDNEGSTLLHYLVKCYNAETIEFVLKYGPDLAKQDCTGSTATDVAVLQGNAVWLRIVLEYVRANKIPRLMNNSTRRGLTPFLSSVLSNSQESMQIILEYEIDTKLTPDLEYGSVQKLRELLLSPSTVGGFTALHLAVMFNCEESIGFILQCQALVNRHSDQKLDLARQSKDEQGQTPLQCAQEANDQQIVDLLLSNQVKHII